MHPYLAHACYMLHLSLISVHGHYKASGGRMIMNGLEGTDHGPFQDTISVFFLEELGNPVNSRS
jgi:hypothetical protein